MNRKIDGFDYRQYSATARTTREWRSEVRAALASGGMRRVVNGETFLFLPITEDLGAPAGECTTQKLAIEIYANIAP